MNDNRKIIMDNLEQFKKSKSIPAKKRAKDWYIQGWQLPRGYLPQWRAIRETSDNYGVDMNQLGPIFSTQASYQVDKAVEITERIKTNQKVRDFAIRCRFPIRSIIRSSDDTDELIDGTIFLMVLRLITKFCFSHSIGQLQNFIENGNSDTTMAELFSLEGHTMEETEEEFEKIARTFLKEVER